MSTTSSTPTTSSPENVFDVTKAVESTKEFRGVIVRAEWGESVLGFEGKPEFGGRKQVGIEISTTEYEKPQYEWYASPETRMRKNTKWFYLMQALTVSGILKELNLSGKTSEDQLNNFAASLVGIDAFWEERANLPGIVRPIDRLLLPTKFFGRADVTKLQQTTVETVKV